MPFPYTICRSRRKTIAISITPEGLVQVRCPLNMKEGDIRRFLEAKTPWVQKHLSAIAARPPEPKLTAGEISTLAEQAKEALPPRVDFYARQLNVTYGRITIRCQRSRWGSCSAKGNLNFNCLLMLSPPQVLDYVIVHELCHRKHMNHSPAFWTEVESILPNYLQPKRWLKDHGPALIARAMPGDNAHPLRR